MKKFALAALLGLSLLPAAAFAQVYVRVAPPAAVVEHPGPPPGAGYEWVGGYHRWDGSHYVWVNGHYDRPPHHGAHWVPAHWAHRNGGYILVEGHWR